MTTEKVEDLTLVKLSDYFTSKKFRTISNDLFEGGAGISEIQVTFNIHQDFLKKLTYKGPSSLRIYGFALMNDKLKELNGAPYVDYNGGGKLKSVTFNDCGELFIMVFESKDQKSDVLYSVKTEDVADLLNNCRHPTSVYE